MFKLWVKRLCTWWLFASTARFIVTWCTIRANGFQSPIVSFTPHTHIGSQSFVAARSCAHRWPIWMTTIFAQVLSIYLFIFPFLSLSMNVLSQFHKDLSFSFCTDILPNGTSVIFNLVFANLKCTQQRIPRLTPELSASYTAIIVCQLCDTKATLIPYSMRHTKWE